MLTVLAAVFFTGVFFVSAWAILSTVVPAWSRIASVLAGEELVERTPITVQRRASVRLRRSPARAQMPVTVRLRAAA